MRRSVTAAADFRIAKLALKLSFPSLENVDFPVINVKTVTLNALEILRSFPQMKIC